MQNAFELFEKNWKRDDLAGDCRAFGAFIRNGRGTHRRKISRTRYKRRIEVL